MESKRNCVKENYHKVYLEKKKARRVPDTKGREAKERSKIPIN